MNMNMKLRPGLAMFSSGNEKKALLSKYSACGCLHHQVQGVCGPSTSHMSQIMQSSLELKEDPNNVGP